MVVGQDQKTLGALVVPALAGFRDAGVKVSGIADILPREDAHRLMDSEIRRLIGAEAGFKPFERIAVWRFVPRSFEVGDELTNTFKLKRHVIDERYAALIAEMFDRKES
jgi:long-chain acyl-CoA synthetase